jgi:hypothetical protein
MAPINTWNPTWMIINIVQSSHIEIARVVYLVNRLYTLNRKTVKARIWRKTFRMKTIVLDNR